MACELLVGLLLVVPVVLYLLDRWAHSYWKKRGVFQLETSFLFGNVRDIIFSKRNLTEYIDQIYKQHKDKRLVGLYSFYKNVLVVTDAELAKDVLTKDFQSFSGPGLELSEKVEPLMAINPFGTLDYNRWKERRAMHVSQHTPAKLRTLPGQFQKILQSLLKKISGLSGSPISIRDMLELFAIDLAISTSLGIEPGALQNQDNIFRKKAKDTAFAPESEKAFLMSLICPIIGKLLKWRFFSNECHELFTTLSAQLIAQREREPSTRGDIIDVIIKAEKKLRSEGKEGFSEDERTAHVFSSYMDSVFTTSAVLRSIILVLASNPEVQDRAREEILAAGVGPEDFVSLEKINSLKYLHMVMNESLRMHPILPILARLCSKTTELGGVSIEPGTKVLIPVRNFHEDPDFYPDPEDFKPGRFEDWRDGQGPHYPFGDGPRMCIGFRYSQLVIKMAIICILQKYKITPVKESDVKDFFTRDQFFSQPNPEASLLFLPL